MRDAQVGVDGVRVRVPHAGALSLPPVRVAAPDGGAVAFARLAVQGDAAGCVRLRFDAVDEAGQLLPAARVDGSCLPADGLGPRREEALPAVRAFMRALGDGHSGAAFVDPSGRFRDGAGEGLAQARPQAEILRQDGSAVLRLGLPPMLSLAGADAADYAGAIRAPGWWGPRRPPVSRRRPLGRWRC
ncbi:hypothetical protein ABXN37_24440 [Piscinibacter sakaiensis]|uniref:hypothetical protein n=1 Tax=Piscinibacter sakaiensis TaxID=1547922 RepID=UPI00372B29F0